MIPGSFRLMIVPRGVTSTSGVIISSVQYLFEAEISPAMVKPAWVAIAILWARPIPASSIPPDQTGTPRSCA